MAWETDRQHRAKLVAEKPQRVVYWEISGMNKMGQTLVDFWQKADKRDRIQTALYSTIELKKHVEDITGLKNFKLERWS